MSLEVPHAQLPAWERIEALEKKQGVPDPLAVAREIRLTQRVGALEKRITAVETLIKHLAQKDPQ